MKNIIKNISVTYLSGTLILFLFLSVVISSCNSDIDFGEQYKKTVYLINSKNLLYSKEHFYGEDNKMVFSVYCASSEPIKQDISVSLKINPNALDSLNTRNKLENPLYIDKVLLPEDYYQAATEYTVTIKANNQYGILEIPLNLAKIAADTAYTLPISIVSNSAGYDINPEMQSVVYEIKMVNKYSGQFSGTSAESPILLRPVQPTAKAISANQVRVPVHILLNEDQYLDTNFMLLTIADDGLVTIEPWRNSTVVDLGNSYYDEVQQLFELHYRFTDGNNIFTITEKITNILAPKINQ